MSVASSSNVVVLSAAEETNRRLQESLRRELGEFCAYLDDPDIVEVSLNPDNKVWVDRLGEPLQCVGMIKPEAAENFISKVAATVRLVINYDHPSVQCRLPIGGHRFQATCPPTTSAWVFSIRRHASSVFTLEEYEERGIITDLQHQAIVQALRLEKNIFVTGGTGSGKTTLLNTLLAHKHVVDNRLIICEDTPELLWTGANVVAMCVNDATTMRDLVVQAMRMRPDRLIIGESREGAAFLETLTAMGTGHKGGMTTLHANNAQHAVSKRMEMLIRQVSVDPLRDLIAETVEVLVHIEKLDRPPHRLVTEIKTVMGYRDGTYELRPLA